MMYIACQCGMRCSGRKLMSHYGYRNQTVGTCSGQQPCTSMRSSVTSSGARVGLGCASSESSSYLLSSLTTTITTAIRQNYACSTARIRQINSCYIQPCTPLLCRCTPAFTQALSIGAEARCKFDRANGGGTLIWWDRERHKSLAYTDQGCPKLRRCATMSSCAASRRLPACTHTHTHTPAHSSCNATARSCSLASTAKPHNSSGAGHLLQKWQVLDPKCRQILRMSQVRVWGLEIRAVAWARMPELKIPKPAVLQMPVHARP